MKFKFGDVVKVKGYEQDAVVVAVEDWYGQIQLPEGPAVVVAFRQVDRMARAHATMIVPERDVELK